MTGEDVQRYARIAVYNVGSFVLGQAAMDGSWGVMAVSASALVANLLWSVYGMRINSKIAEWSKLGRDPAVPVLPPVVTDTMEGRRIAMKVPGVVIAPQRS